MEGIYKVYMTNEKNGFNSSNEFFGTYNQCQNYLKATKEELEEDEIEELELTDDYLTGYGGYGHFSYEILLHKPQLIGIHFQLRSELYDKVLLVNINDVKKIKELTKEFIENCNKDNYEWLFHEIEDFLEEKGIEFYNSSGVQLIKLDNF